MTSWHITSLRTIPSSDRFQLGQLGLVIFSNKTSNRIHCLDAVARFPLDYGVTITSQLFCDISSFRG